MVWLQVRHHLAQLLDLLIGHQVVIDVHLVVQGVEGLRASDNGLLVDRDIELRARRLSHLTVSAQNKVRITKSSLITQKTVVKLSS